MRVPHFHSVRWAALSSALIVLSSSVTAYSSSSTTSKGCIPLYIANGDCDLFNNNEECGYDGGDCCECTCVTTEYYVCGRNGGYSCIDPSADCVDDDDVTVNPDDEYNSGPKSFTSFGCAHDVMSDGDCDEINNNELCGYDEGDCCECTCSSTDLFECGDASHGGYVCLDPSAPCVNDDDATLPEDDDDDVSTGDQIPSYPESYSTSDTQETTSLDCVDASVSDGICDVDNNNDECGYDGGDCCECDCVSTSENTCGEDEGYDCVDPSSRCINGYVLASTKTSVGVSANAYDTRPGADSNMVGCWEDGCASELCRDGISDDIESRWSCAQKIVPDGGLCEIEFTFSDAQDIKEVQVAFWKGDERSRTLEVAINGEVIGDFDSYTGSTFNALGIDGVGVNSLTLTAVGLPEDDWISLLEVRFLVDG